MTWNHIQSPCCQTACHMLKNNISKSDIHVKAIRLIYTFKKRTRKAQLSGSIFFLHIGEPISAAEKTERKAWAVKSIKTIIQ